MEAIRLLLKARALLLTLTLLPAIPLAQTQVVNSTSLPIPSSYDCSRSPYDEAHRLNKYCVDNPTDRGCFMNSQDDEYQSCTAQVCSGVIYSDMVDYERCNTYCPAFLETYCRIPEPTTTVRPTSLPSTVLTNLTKTTLPLHTDLTTAANRQQPLSLVMLVLIVMAGLLVLAALFVLLSCCLCKRSNNSGRPRVMLEETRIMEPPQQPEEDENLM